MKTPQDQYDFFNCTYCKSLFISLETFVMLISVANFNVAGGNVPYSARDSIIVIVGRTNAISHKKQPRLLAQFTMAPLSNLSHCPGMWCHFNAITVKHAKNNGCCFSPHVWTVSRSVKRQSCNMHIALSLPVGCSRQFWRSRQIWRSSPN